jgi:hypothetical protein
MAEELKKASKPYKIWKNPARKGDPIEYLGDFYPPSGNIIMLAEDLKALGFGPGHYTVRAPDDAPHSDFFAAFRSVRIPE